MLKALMKHVIVRREEVVIMDMEAGIEHLGRGTAESVDAMLVVVEPGQRSVQTARQIQKLAADLKLRRVFLVLNKVHDGAEEAQLRAHLPELPVIGTVRERESIRRADLDGPLAVRRRPRVRRRRSRSIKERLRTGNRGVSRRARQLTEGKRHADYRREDQHHVQDHRPGHAHPGAQADPGAGARPGQGRRPRARPEPRPGDQGRARARCSGWSRPSRRSSTTRSSSRSTPRTSRRWRPVSPSSRSTSR